MCRNDGAHSGKPGQHLPVWGLDNLLIVNVYSVVLFKERGWGLFTRVVRSSLVM